MLEDEIRSEGTRCFAAAEGKTAVGYCCVQSVLDEAELLRIAVRREWRGAGIGRALLQDMKRTLTAEHIAKLFLEVRETNLAARRLYQTEGFEEIAVRKKYYGTEDAVIMRCILNKPLIPDGITKKLPYGLFPVTDKK